jgi:hypothetical protein
VPHDRSEPVRADDEVATFLAGVLRSYYRPALVRLDDGDRNAESHLTRRIRQHGLKIGPVDGDCAGQKIGRHPCELLTIGGQNRAHRGGCASARNPLRDAETLERTHRVCEQHDARPDRIDPRRALEHDDLVPEPAQSDRGAQAAGAATDDDRAHRSA